jgi:hypothetical protein
MEQIGGEKDVRRNLLAWGVSGDLTDCKKPWGLKECYLNANEVTQIYEQGIPERCLQGMQELISAFNQGLLVVQAGELVGDIEGQMRARVAAEAVAATWDRVDLTQYGPPWDTRPPPGLGESATHGWLKMQSKLRAEAGVESPSQPRSEAPNEDEPHGVYKVNPAIWKFKIKVNPLELPVMESGLNSMKLGFVKGVGNMIAHHRFISIVLYRPKGSGSVELFLCNFGLEAQGPAPLFEREGSNEVTQMSASQDAKYFGELMLTPIITFPDAGATSWWFGEDYWNKVVAGSGKSLDINRTDKLMEFLKYLPRSIDINGLPLIRKGDVRMGGFDTYNETDNPVKMEYRINVKHHVRSGMTPERLRPCTIHSGLKEEVSLPKGWYAILTTHRHFEVFPPLIPTQNGTVVYKSFLYRNMEGQEYEGFRKPHLLSPGVADYKEFGTEGPMEFMERAKTDPNRSAYNETYNPLVSQMLVPIQTYAPLVSIDCTHFTDFVWYLFNIDNTYELSLRSYRGHLEDTSIARFFFDMINTPSLYKPLVPQEDEGLIPPKLPIWEDSSSDDYSSDDYSSDDETPSLLPSQASQIKPPQSRRPKSPLRVKRSKRTNKEQGGGGGRKYRYKTKQKRNKISRKRTYKRKQRKRTYKRKQRKRKRITKHSKRV